MASLPAALFASSSLSVSTTTLSGTDAETGCSAVETDEFITEDGALVVAEEPAQDLGEEEPDGAEGAEAGEVSGGVVTRYLEDGRFIRRRR